MEGSWELERGTDRESEITSNLGEGIKMLPTFLVHPLNID